MASTLGAARRNLPLAPTNSYVQSLSTVPPDQINTIIRES